MVLPQYFYKYRWVDDGHFTDFIFYGISDYLWGDRLSGAEERDFVETTVSGVQVEGRAIS